MFGFFTKKRLDLNPKKPIAEIVNRQTHSSQRELIQLQNYARRFDIRHAKLAHAQLLGNHRSSFRGRGMDYQESRIYQAGDDIRNMDWRVTARSGKAHTKLFQEERERPLVLFVDLSPSLFFATQGVLKSVVATRAAAMLAWVASVQGDRVGGLIYNGDYHELKARSNQRGVLPFIHELVEQSDPVKGLNKDVPEDGFNDALVRLRRIVKPGSLVILLSDFYGLNEHSNEHFLRLRQHNDVFAMQMLDPIEQSAPPAGHYQVTDGVSNGVLNTRSKSGVDEYESFFKQRQQVLETRLKKAAIPMMQLSTIDNVVERLQRQFPKSGRQASRAVK